MSLKDFREWLSAAAPGNNYVYARRSPVQSGAGFLSTNEARLLAARNAAAAGLVFLAQRKLKDGDVLYEATRISPLAARILQKLNDRLVAQDRLKRTGAERRQAA